MNSKIIISKNIFLLNCLILILCFCNTACAMVIDNSEGQEGGPVEPILGQQDEARKAPEYVPGEVLVKFKEGVDPSSVLKEVSLEVKSIERIHSIKPAITKFNKDYKLEKDPQGGWYSFLGKQYKEVSEIPNEEMFKEAYRNMPEVEKSLYRSYKIELPEGTSVEEAISKLKDSPDIEYAYPNYIRDAYVIPNDPDFTRQWSLNNTGASGALLDADIDAPEAWDITWGDPDIVIAVIDTGVDYTHPDLTGKIWINADEIPGNGRDDDGNGYVDDFRGYDFVSVQQGEVAAGEDPGPRDNNPMDIHGHGTHVSGIAAAAFNNNIGISGVAPLCDIMPVRAGYKTARGGNFTDSDIEAAILYAVQNGARVINMSFGGSAMGAYKDEIRYAYIEGVVCVAAAGNSGDVTRHYPAAMGEVISVAATSSTDEKSSYSNYGAWVDVAAPGNLILSTLPNNLYAPWSGTSMACPHVSGLAALLLSRHGDYNNNQVKWLIKNTVDSLAALEGYFFPGFGRVNAFAAVSYPNTPPRLDSWISDIEIDYTGKRIHILGTANGQDFLSYRLQYRKSDDTWGDITSSSTSIYNGELCDWHVNNPNIPQDALVRLTVYSAQQEAMAYASLHFDTYIEPEDMINAIFYYSTLEETYTIARPGAVISFKGKVFGAYHLEWSRTGSADWNSAGFDYNNMNPGYLGRWDTSITGGEGIYYVRLVDDLGNEKVTKIILDGAIRAGWPVVMAPYNILGTLDSSSVHTKLGNLDDDTRPELVSLRTHDYSARIYIYDDTGNVKPGGPIIINGEIGKTYYPALADIDGDGIDEIFMTTVTQGAGNLITHLHCFTADGDIIFERTFTGGAPSNEPVIVYDLDNDGNKEIIYKYRDGIYILDEQGNDLPGWPSAMSSFFFVDSQEGTPSYMAIGNFDSDTDLEFAVIQYVLQSGQDLGNIVIHIFNIDGSHVTGWPRTIEGAKPLSSICCGDMDADGYDELTVSGINSQYQKRLYVYRHDGTILFDKIAGLQIGIDFFIMADLNSDNKAELIFTEDYNSGANIHAVDSYGADISGWPCNLTDALYPGARLVCDIDGDDIPEVIGKYISRDNRKYYTKLFVINDDGSLDVTNPLNNKFIPEGVSSFNYCDIDNDGTGELVIDANLPVWIPDNIRDKTSLWYWKPSIYVLETGHAFKPNPRYWPEYFSDKANTSRYVIPPPQITAITPAPIIPGSIITVSGRGFGSTQGASRVVHSNGYVFSIRTWSNTRIECYVPWNIQPGSIKVITNAGISNAVNMAVDKIPSTGTVTPSTYTPAPNNQMTFTATYMDGDGYQDIEDAYLLVDTPPTNPLDGARYNLSEDKLYLRSADGTTWLGGYPRGSNNQIDNGFFVLNCAETTKSGLGNTLTITWKGYFKPTYTGVKTMYLKVTDKNGAGGAVWDPKGTITIMNYAPQVGNMTSSIPSGSYYPGQKVTFTSTFTDPNGADDIYYVLSIWWTAPGQHYDAVLYDAVNNKLYILNDATTQWIGGYSPGEDKVISNSYMELHCLNTTVTPPASATPKTGNTLTVNSKVKFYSTAEGTKYLHLNVADRGGLSPNWVYKGTWTIRPLNRIPVVTNIPNALTRNEGDTITRAQVELATDPDGNTLTYTYSGWVTSLPYTIGYDQAGPHTLHVDVSDGTTTVGKDIAITVNNINRAPATGTMTPSIPSNSYYPGQEVTFTTTCTDPDGANDILSVAAIFQTSTGWMAVAYWENQLYMTNDATTGWIGGNAPGSSNIIKNSHMELNCGTTTVSRSGNTLYANFNVRFYSTESGTKNMYLNVADRGGLSPNWVYKGTWTIRPDTIPQAGTVTPSSGSFTLLSTYTFRALYNDNYWANDISLVGLSIWSTPPAAGRYGGVYYDAVNDLLYIASDDGTRLLGGVRPGTNPPIYNSYAVLDCATTTVTSQGSNLTVNWKIRFKPLILGTRNIYSNVKCRGGATSGWQWRGTIRIN